MSLTVMSAQQQHHVDKKRKRRTLKDMWGIKSASPAVEEEVEVVNEADIPPPAPLPRSPPPSLRIVLKLPSESLRPLDTKKRVHPFFRKRVRQQEQEVKTNDTTEPSSLSLAKLNKHHLYHSPTSWNLHVRSMTPEEVQICRDRPRFTVNNRRPNRRGKRGIMSAFGESIAITTTGGQQDMAIKRPQRCVMKCQDILELATSQVKDKKLSSLCTRACKLSPFDEGKYETNMWMSKYYYDYYDTISDGRSSTPQTIVYDWLRQRQDLSSDKSDQKKLTSIKESLRKMKRKKKREKLMADASLDGFICYSEEEGGGQEDESTDDDGSRSQGKRNYLLLHGPISSGKTSSVYKAAMKLDFIVFKVDASQRRSAKDLLNEFGEMTNNHLVKKSKSSKEFKSKGLILLQNIDILFQDEVNIWEAIEKFSASSKRPIIMTCQDLYRIPKEITGNSFNNIVEFNRFINIDWLWLICLCEGHIIEKSNLYKLVKLKNNDMVSALCQLQFWCQMGIGSRLGSFDWSLSREQMMSMNIRVMSNATYHYDLDDVETADWNIIPTSQQQEEDDNNNNFSLKDYDKFCQFRSCSDIIDSNQKPLIKIDNSWPPKDEIITLKTLDTRSNSTILDELCEDSFSNNGALDVGIKFLNSKHMMFDQYNNNNNNTTTTTTTTTTTPQEIRTILNPLSLPATWFNDYTPINSIECSTMNIISTELAPFARFIARLIKMRSKILNQFKFTSHGGTMTRSISNSSSNDTSMMKSKSNAARIIVENPDIFLSTGW